ncbi:MAG: sigma-70 family RNA polymerase sigma factor [Pirellulales bacterium]
MSFEFSRPADGSDNGFAELLESARGGDREALGELLQWYCNYLTILATTQLDRRLQRRLSPSDLVQDTLLAAHRDFSAFRGSCERELLGWLRQILINSLHRAIDVHLRAGKRDLRREVSMDELRTSVDRSAMNFAGMIAGSGTSPSAPAQARERAVALANELAKLPEHYREVIIYRNLQNLPFEEIATRMDRTVGAVRMLWLRAIDKFKETCGPID